MICCWHWWYTNGLQIFISIAFFWLRIWEIYETLDSITKYRGMRSAWTEHLKYNQVPFHPISYDIYLKAPRPPWNKLRKCHIFYTEYQMVLTRWYTGSTKLVTLTFLSSFSPWEIHLSRSKIKRIHDPFLSFCPTHVGLAKCLAFRLSNCEKYRVTRRDILPTWYFVKRYSLFPCYEISDGRTTSQPQPMALPNSSWPRK